jgi:hypothetical protein
VAYRLALVLVFYSIVIGSHLIALIGFSAWYLQKYYLTDKIVKTAEVMWLSDFEPSLSVFNLYISFLYIMLTWGVLD